MQPLVNHLIQLQELILVRDEQKVAGHGEHLQALDASIRGMLEELPDEARAVFERLHKRDPVVIAPIAENGCAICGMKLPISLIQSVRHAREIHACPTCAHILYFPESVPRRVKQPLRRSEPPKPGVSRFSSETLMIPDLEAADRDGVIRELAARMEQQEFVDSAERLAESALRREAILSTALEQGLAFPHVRGVEGGGLTFALGISRKGVCFDGPGGGLSRIIFLIAIPTAASAFYLKLLSGLTQTFMASAARKAIMAEKEPRKLWRTLVKLTRPTIK